MVKASALVVWFLAEPISPYKQLSTLFPPPPEILNDQNRQFVDTSLWPITMLPEIANEEPPTT